MLALPSPLAVPKHYHPFSSPSLWIKPTTNPLSSDSISLPQQKPISRNSRWDALEQDLVKVDPKQVSTHPKRALKSSSNSREAFRLNLKRLVESNRLDDAKRLHNEMKSQGFEPGVVLESVLINVFMKSGRVFDAFLVFEEMPERNVVTWTSMISGCARNGRSGTGLYLFVEMLKSGVLPNDFSFNAVLQACADLVALDHGLQVHSLIIRSGLEGDVRTRNCLIDFYSRCGLMDEAVLIFDGMSEPDLVTYTSLITGFCKNNFLELAIRAFDKLVRWGLEPNEHTIASVLMACSPLLGEQIHGYMIKTMFDQSLYSASALIEFYSRNDAFKQAKLIFSKLEAKNVVTWSSMISCCIRNGQVDDALIMFCEMIYSDIKPNEFTFATAIGACGYCSELIGLGRQLHCSVAKLNLDSDDHVFNALLTMYARNGEIEELEKVFGKTKDPGIVSWCAVISGYFQNGYYEKSTSLLCQMHRKGYNPNEYGFSSAMSSSANLALLDQGRQFHCFALKLGCDLDISTGNALVNMYAKCGYIDDARLAFDVMPIHDVMSWNSLIHGYAQFGHEREALEIFAQMAASNSITPDHSTFVGVLVACSHTGHVDEAFKYFKIMRDHYGITPSASHYACIIDMLGRAGRLHEAVQIINQVPFEPDFFIWKTLLGSCRLHKNLDLGKLAAVKVIELSPKDSATYVLLSNLHAMHGEWDDAESVRNMMEERGVKKDAAWSWIEVSNVVHAFVARDNSHPRAEAIYKKLEELMKEMKDEGYSPDSNSAAYDL